MLVTALVLALGCGNTTNPCTAGASSPCACTDGRMGAQLCRSDGTYDECVCAGSDAGSDGDGGRRADAGRDASTSSDRGGDPRDSGRPDGGGTADSGNDGGSATGYVLHLPTDESRVIVSNPDGDLFSDVFTYELWVNFDRIAPGVSQFLLNSNRGTIGMNDPDNLQCFVASAKGGYDRAGLANASVQISAAAWHHVACTYDGAGNLALFVDGIQRATGRVRGSLAPLGPGAGLGIGIGQSPAALPSPSLHFRGLIDEVRVSNAVMYPGPPARHLGVETSTVALFRFDEGTGTTTTDAVGPGQHPAVLDSGATWAAE